MQFTARIAALSLLPPLWSGAALADADPTGIWVMENGKVTVRVSYCGEKLCGTIVGMAKPLDKKGKPKRDKHNPNPALRDRPVIGMRILYDMKPTGDGWWEGLIYNASDGRTYSSQMKLKGKSMVVRGCVIVICKSMDFNRAN